MAGLRLATFLALLAPPAALGQSNTQTSAQGSNVRIPTEAPAAADPYDTYNCLERLAGYCVQHSDCEDPTGSEGAIKECGTATCDFATGTCGFVASESDLVKYPQCADTFVQCGTWQGANLPWAGDDSKCNAVPRSTGSVGRCDGYNNNECTYKWCPGDAKPTTSPTVTKVPTVTPTIKPTLSQPDPAYDDFVCPAQNTCRRDEDCKDANHLVGAKEECGDVFCDRTRGPGVCRFAAWNSKCTDIFVMCANAHALCYKGPKEIDYYGSCSGYSNNECRYAFCPGVPAKPPTTTLTPAPTPLPGITDVPISITVSIGGSTPYLTPGGNILLKAMGIFPGEAQPRDITGDCTWTSFYPSVADFLDFPALIWGKALGEVFVEASLNGVKGSTILTVSPQLSGGPSCGVRTVDMKVLVIRQSVALDEARGAETVVPAIERALGYVGIPYDLYRITDIPNLSWTHSQCEGKYQAVIITDGGLKWQPPGFVDSKGLNLELYCAFYNVRMINWFTWPSDAFGWDGTTSFGTAEARQVTLTAAGQDIFDYMNPSHTVQLEYVWNQVAKPLPGSTPLLEDAEGNVYACLYKVANREMLTMTFGSNQFTRHMVELSYGAINWATRGRFIGFRRVYVRADMDDYFIDDDIFAPSVPCGTPTDSTGIKWRMNATDLQGVVDWQVALGSDPIAGEVVLDMVFNGIGSTGSLFTPDSLTPLTRTTHQNFRWVGHGWDHLNEDATSYQTAFEEVFHNQIIAAAGELGLTRFDPKSMVTGQVSGLKNPNFLNAASDLGVEYLVSDTSRVEEINGVVYDENPGMNKGLYNWFQPKIFMIPRRPNNLFYNVALREEWVHEYNCIFNSFWGRDLTLDEIIDFEAEMLVGYMLAGEKYPWMFHQANMRIYFIDAQGTKKFLLEELFDAVFAKFKAVYTIPITSPRMDVLGKDVISHNEIGTKNVRGVYAPGLGCLLRADVKTRTPCTGFRGDENLLYGGQNQCYAHLFPGVARFVPES